MAAYGQNRTLKHTCHQQNFTANVVLLGRWSGYAISAMLSLRINPNLDESDLATAFARDGRVHAPGFLTPDAAEALSDAIAAETRWNLVAQLDGKHVDLDAAGVEALDPGKQEEFLAAVHAQARSGFQYLYENFPLYDIVHHDTLPDHPLIDLFTFLNGPDFLSFARRLADADDIGFVDAQVTRYGPGHFLAGHDDAVLGKNRRAAYVLNLTRAWRVDWGGQLLFFDETGNVTGGFTPAWNALNVFQVPARHSVALVAPFAKGRRISVTGWFRAGTDPGPD